jgi:RimJ/RimL family protein N-acetyltransferase
MVAHAWLADSREVSRLGCPGDDLDGEMADAVTLREVDDGGLATFHVQQLDPVATEMAAFRSPDRQSFDAHWATLSPSVTHRTIVVGEAVAGYVLAFTLAGERLVGYWIGREHWGRGVATKAPRLFLEVDASRPLYAQVAKHNLGSLRVLAKCGFTVIREQTASGRGVSPEEVVFGLGHQGEVT